METYDYICFHSKNESVLVIDNAQSEGCTGTVAGMHTVMVAREGSWCLVYAPFVQVGR